MRILCFVLPLCATPLLAWAAPPSWTYRIETSPGVSSASSFRLYHPGAIPREFKGVVWFRCEVARSELPPQGPVAVFLGRVADADQAFWNGQKIGETGMSLGTPSFFPHKSRSYLLPADIQETNELLLKVHKLHIGILGVGPEYHRPEFGDAQLLARKSFNKDIIRIWIPLLMGAGLILVGLFFALIHIRLPQKRDYFWFALSCTTFGIYAMCFSYWPYEWTSRVNAVFLCHALSAYTCLYATSQWVLGDQPQLRRPLRILGFVTAGLTALSVWRIDIDAVVDVFLSWHTILIIQLAVLLVDALRKAFQSSSKRFEPLMAMSIVFFVAVIYDTLISRQIIHGEQLAVPAFGFILAAAALKLGSDFAFAYGDVQRTVQERTQDLSRAMERIKTLEQFRRDFFTNVSHDFKTPLAVALSYLNEIKQGTQGLLFENANRASSALGKLRGMLDDVLETLRSDTDHEDLHVQVTAPRQLIQSALPSLVKVASDKGITLTYDPREKEEVMLDLDRQHVERILENVVSNAIKFTPRGGSIHLETSCDDKSYRLTCEDSGPGVPVQDREKIFDRYAQASNHDAQIHGGVGIGLSYVREAMRRMGGDIIAVDGETYATRFVLTWPLPSHEKSLGGAYPSPRKAGRLEAEALAYPRAIPEEIHSTWPTLLIAEDNPDLAHTLVRSLSSHYNVYFAPNGRAAFELAQSYDFDGVLSDLMMPEMTGTDLLKHMKAHTRLKPIPFILLTAKDEQQAVVEHLRLGAQDYISKPFDPEVLYARVRAHVTGYRLQREVAASQKLVSLGLLSAGLAHEIRNPLHAVMNHFEGLKRERSRALIAQNPGHASDGELIEAVLEDIRVCLNRIAEVMQSIGGYVGGTERLGPIDLSESVKQALVILEARRRELGVSITVLPSKEASWVIQGFPSLHQAITNIMLNAVEAASQRLPQVEVSFKDLGDQIELSIADTGHGIAPEHRPYIFDAFFTQKATGQGMGLYVSKAIVEYQHLGELGFRSEVGQGTCFYLRLFKNPDFTQRPMLNFKGFPIPL